MNKFKVNQKIWYLYNNLSGGVDVKSSTIDRIEINEDGIVYVLNDGYFRNMGDWQRDTRLKEDVIFATEEEAYSARAINLISNIEKQVEQINNKLKQEKLNFRVVIKNEN